MTNDCTLCGLHRGRTKIVYGVGSTGARLMAIGEAPGQLEDLAGEPFVGPAGQLLNHLLGRAGLKRADLYITNVVKCRPPGNRDPEPDEIAACAPNLRAQIQVVNPKVIITLGRFAASRMTLQWGSLSALLDQKLVYRPTLEYTPGKDGPSIPVIPQYHPAYLLRQIHAKSPDAKALLQDFIRRLETAKKIAESPTQLSFRI